jgi:hypothetical protein
MSSADDPRFFVTPDDFRRWLHANHAQRVERAAGVPKARRQGQRVAHGAATVG